MRRPRGPTAGACRSRRAGRRRRRTGRRVRRRRRTPLGSAGTWWAPRGGRTDRPVRWNRTLGTRRAGGIGRKDRFRQALPEGGMAPSEDSHPPGDRYRSRMARSRLLGLGVAVALLAGVATATALDPRAGWREFVFGGVVSLSAAAAVLLAGRAGRRFRAERERARRLSGTSAEDVARQAVSGERARLAADIEGVVRTAAREMGRAAEEADRGWDRNPFPALRAVQDHGHRAGIELRRLLGLLRDADDEPPGAGAEGPREPRISRVDVLVASAVTALAVVEHFVWAAVEGVGSAQPVV